MTNNISNVVKKAFDWLGQTSYPETGFSHAADETRMKDAVKALYSFGERFNDAMLEYAQELGWPKKAIEKIQKQFIKVANGKTKYKEYSESFFREHWMINDSEFKFKGHITSITSCPLWNGKIISWSNLQNVNILVGINGSGKTTFLNRLYDFIVDENQKKIKMVIDPDRNRLGPITFIRAIDNSLVDKKKNESVLTRQLELVINQNPKAPSFFNYRLRALDNPKQANLILKNIKDLFACVDSFFVETEKRIAVSSNPARLFFKTSNGGEVDIDQLSSGEKQLLYILLQDFVGQSILYLLPLLHLYQGQV